MKEHWALWPIRIGMLLCVLDAFVQMQLGTLPGGFGWLATSIALLRMVTALLVGCGLCFWLTQMRRRDA